MKLGTYVVEMYNYEKILMDKRNQIWEAINANGDCDLTPSEIMRKRPASKFLQTYVSWGKYSPTKINIAGGNRMLVDQAGRALAMIGSWEVVDQYDEMLEPSNYPKMPVSRVGYHMLYGTAMMHKVTGRIVGCCMVEKITGSTKVQIAEVFNWDTVAKKWTLHGITIQVRETGTSWCESAFTYNRRLNEFSPAYTKYHFLAEFLTGGKINILCDEVAPRQAIDTEWYKELVYTFRHELWSRICGYDQKAVMPFEKLYSKAKAEMVKMVSVVNEE